MKRVSLTVWFLTLCQAASPNTGLSGPSCPFLTQDSNQDVLKRAQAKLKSLQDACKPDENSPLGSEITTLSSMVSSLHDKLRADIVIPSNLVGDWSGLPVTCSNYSGALGNQRSDALRRLQYEMSSPDDRELADCFDKGAVQSGVDCIHKTANERVQTAAKFCNGKRSQIQDQALQQSVSEGYNTVDNALAQIFKRLPDDCKNFGNQGAIITNHAVQLTTSLAASFAMVQPISQAVGIGIVMGSSLLRHASEHLFNPENKAYARFKEAMEYPSKACLLFELQQRQLACDHLLKPTLQSSTKPRLNAPERELAGDGTSSPGAVQDVLNAMKATDAAFQGAAAQGGVVDGVFPSLDELDDFLMNRIPNPLTAHKPAENGRIQTYTYLRQVAADLKTAKANGQQEKLALEQMSAELTDFLNAYAKYKEAQTTASIRTAQDDLLKKLSPLMSPIWKKEEYRYQSAAGLKEMLDRHWDTFLPAEGALNQLRRYEYVQAMLRPIDEMELPNSEIGASYTAARDIFLDDIVKALQDRRKELNSKLEYYKKKFDARASTATGTLKIQFSQVALPLLQLCTSLASSLNATPKSAAAYRSACDVFQCNGAGLPVFDPANSADAPQELSALQCKNVYEAKRWETLFESRFTNLESPGEFCEAVDTPGKQEPFFDSIKRKLWNHNRRS